MDGIHAVVDHNLAHKTGHLGCLSLIGLRGNTLKLLQFVSDLTYILSQLAFIAKPINRPQNASTNILDLFNFDGPLQLTQIQHHRLLAVLGETLSDGLSL